MKMKRLVFCALTCLASVAFAQRTISVNFGANSVASTVPSDNTAYAGVQSLNATCDLWNNMTGENQTLATIKSSTTNNCGASVVVVQAQAAWGPTIADSSRVNGHENRKLLGRYMDLSSGNQYTVTISNIPFPRYKAYVILSGDGGTYASVIVNGVNYCGSGNSTIPGTSIWGTRTTDWTWLQTNCGNSYLKEGVNYLAVPNLLGTLTVKNAISGNRVTLAAIQIEELPFDGVAWKGAATENNWNNSTNWWTWPVAGSNLFFIGTTRTATITNNFTAGTVFSNITFEALATGGNTNWTITGNSFNLSGNLALRTAQTVTMNTAMALTRSPMITVTNGGNMTLGGVLNGAYNVLKDGGGTLVLTAANTYSGATVVTGGVLRVSNTLRNTSSCVASNGGTLELGCVNMFVGGHGIALPSSNIISANGSTIFMNTGMESRIGNVTLQNGSTWTCDRALTYYDILFADNASGPSTLTVSGTGMSTMNGASGIHLVGIQNFDVADTTSSSSPDLMVNMILGSQGTTGGAAGGVRKLGTGTMVLTAANTYTGATIIDAGTVQVGTNRTTGVLGAGNITNNATLVFNRSNAMTVNNTIAGNGTINQYGSGTLTIGGNNSAFTGTLNITNGTIIPTHAGAFGAGTVNVSGSSVIDIQSIGAITPTAALVLSGTPTIRVKYNATQDPVVTTITGTATLNVDVAGITQTGSYKVLGSSSDLGLASFTFQLINTAPGLESNWSSDALGVYLNVTAAPKIASWKELATGDWDQSSLNWTTDGLDSVAFVAGDQVILPNYPSLDAAVLTLKGNYTVSGLLVTGNETDYTVALDTGTALEARVFAKTGTGFFSFPGSLTVTPGVVTNVTGTMTIGTLTAPALSLSVGANVTLTNDASRLQSATVTTNSTLTIPSAVVLPNNVTVVAGAYPNQAVVRLAGGSASVTNFPFTDKQATFLVEKEVNLGASAYFLGGNQSLVLGTGGSFLTTNEVFSCATARLLMNEGGAIKTLKLAFGNTAAGQTSTIVQDGGRIEVTGNVSADLNTSSIMLAHWASTTTYDMSGGSFIADNAQVMMGLDGTPTWTISGSAYVRVKGLRLRGRTAVNSTVNMNGGALEIGSLGITTAVPGNSFFNWNGGTIRASADFPINLSTAVVTLGSGATCVLDLNGRTITKASNFAGTGTLCITNTGRIAQSAGYIVNSPNLLFVGNAGLLMKLDNTLATSEKFTTGALTLQDNPALTFTLDLQNKTKLQKQYPLIEASSIAGSLSGAAVTLQNNVSGVTCVLEVQGNTVYAVLSGGNLADPVYWKDLSSGSWDKSTMNWVTNSVDVLFDDDKRVVFDDLAVNAATTVTVTEPVNPENISFESDSTAYTVAGTSRITVPVVSCTGTNATMVTAPLTAGLVEILTNTLVTVNEPTSLLKASQIAPNATLAVVPSALGNVPTGTGVLELLSGTYRLTNANFAAGTVKVTDVGTRAEYVYNAATPVTAIAGAGTFAFVSTNTAVQDPIPGNPLLTSTAFTGTLKLESVGQMRINNAGQANWRTTFQNLPSASTLFFGKGVQYFGAPFALKAKLAFEDGAQLTDHFQDNNNTETFGQLRLGAGATWFSNNVHLGASSIIRFGSDATAVVWFKHSITGPGSKLQFGSGYTLDSDPFQAEMDCSNSAETLNIRNNGLTGRVTVNAWGASSLGNNLVSETTGSSSSFIVNIGDFATPVNAAVRTVNGSNADDVIALNHASGSLTIDGVSNSTYSGKFTGVGKLVKSGNGTLTLAGNSTFTGGLVLNAGTVVPKHANALGASTATLTLNNGGVLDLSASGVVMPAQTNVVAAGMPSIRMNCTNATDMTINGISGVVNLNVLTAGAVEGVEYKLINSNTTLSLTNFTVSLTGWNVGFGALTAKADGIYLSLKRGTMIQFQ
jgi:autotransporter-associated beta strand protein